MYGLSVIMPAFNEAEKIENSINKSLEIFSSFKIPFELIIVNDGSTDSTEGIVKSISQKNNLVNLVSYPNNQGKGHALKYASQFANMDLVTFVDADLELNPIQLKKFIEIMDSTKSDIVIGSKHHPESIVNYPLKRKFLSEGYYLLNRIFFNLPVKDTQAGLKLFKKEVVNRVFPKMIVKGFAFDLEVLVIANKLGYKIVEAPIDIHFSRFKSRIGCRSARNILMDTLGILYRLKVLKFYD